MPDRSLDLAADHFRSGRFEQARTILNQSLRRNPRDPQAASLLVSVLLGLGQNDQAEFHARRAIELAPKNPEPRFNLGIMLSRLGRHADAATAFGQTAELTPSDPIPRRLQIAALMSAFLLTDALAAADRALADLPDDPELPGARARVLLMLGRAAQAVASLRVATSTYPGSLFAARQLASAAIYDDQTEPAELFGLHRRAGELLESTVPDRPCPIRDPDPQRPIRIGFLSGDLCNHVVAIFLAPLLAHLNRERFHAYCYFTGPREDHVSKALAASARVWRHAPGLEPSVLAGGIRADDIDILIELGGYTQDSPIDAAAWRAAPLQVSYLGYPSSTGLTRIDARIIDSLTDPADGPDPADALATERLVRLDPCFLTFAPPPAGFVPDRPPPCQGIGSVTFGSFNAFHKITGSMLTLWARILAGVPDSRLAIKNMGLVQEAARDSLRERAAQAGIDPRRLRLLPPTPGYHEHLRSYDPIDLALDTFPYCGTTTTCEALAMGVPVISLVGRNHASRVGLSLLTAAGMPTLAAASPDEYVRLAMDLANHPERLTAVRAALRTGFAASPLCDSAAFSARFGAALQSLWQARCARA